MTFYFLSLLTLKLGTLKFTAKAIIKNVFFITQKICL